MNRLGSTATSRPTATLIRKPCGFDLLPVVRGGRGGSWITEYAGETRANARTRGDSGRRPVRRNRKSNCLADFSLVWSLFTRKIACGETPNATYGETAASKNGATATANRLSAYRVSPPSALGGSNVTVPTGSSSNITPSRWRSAGSRARSGLGRGAVGDTATTSALPTATTGGGVGVHGWPGSPGTTCVSASRTNP